jgi:nitrogen fixation protein
MGTAYISLNTIDPTTTNKASQQLRIGDWVIQQNSTGNLQFTNNTTGRSTIITAAGDVVADNYLRTLGGVVDLSNGWTLKSASDLASFQKDGTDKVYFNGNGNLYAANDMYAIRDVYAGGNLTASAGNVNLTNLWKVSQNSGGNLQFTNNTTGKSAFITAAGDVIAMNDVRAVGNLRTLGVVDLSNGWTLKTDSGNARFRYNDSDKVYFNSSGNLYVTGNETGIGNGWTLKTNSSDAKFRYNGIDKGWSVDSEGNVTATGGNVNLGNGWKLNTDTYTMRFQNYGSTPLEVKSYGSINVSAAVSGDSVRSRSGNWYTGN